MGCKLEKLIFPYGWLDSYEKLSHVEPVGYENFYSSLKTTIAKDKYKPFWKCSKKMVDKNGWLTASIQRWRNCAIYWGL